MDMPRQEDVGRRVTYRPIGMGAHGRGEKGEIRAVGELYVFVLFDGNVLPKACSPETLEFISDFI